MLKCFLVVFEGGVRYSISQANSPEEAFRDFWTEVHTMMITEQTDISTVLLVYPTRLFNDERYFQIFTQCLDHALTKESANFSDEIQLVFFHPAFKFTDKDGQVVMVFDDQGEPIGLSSEISKPIDYSRRSPHPIINIVRTPQVSAVQQNVPEGLL